MNFIDWLVKDGTVLAALDSKPLKSDNTEITTWLALDADEEETWITTENNHRVKIDEEGNIEAGFGGKFNGENIREVGGMKESQSPKTSSWGKDPAPLASVKSQIEKAKISDDAKKILNKKIDDLESSLDNSSMQDSTKRRCYKTALKLMRDVIAGERAKTQKSSLKTKSAQSKGIVSGSIVENIIRAAKGELKEPNEITGVIKGAPMSIEKADKNLANPLYFGPDGKNNCQSCIATYEARRRGFDVTASKKGVGTVQEYISEGTNFTFSWCDPKTGLPPSVKKLDTYDEKCIDKVIKPGQRGVIGVAWKNNRWGHVMNVERDKDGVVIVDAQSGKKYRGADIGKLFERTTRMIEYARVDNMVLNGGTCEHLMG